MGVKLKRLVVSGFRSFLHQSAVTFPEQGMVLLRGANRSTSGSSGSGKSNLNLAIAFALGYCNVPATRLRTWNYDGSWFVEVELESAKGSLTIRRGSSFSVKLNGETVRGAAADREVAIRTFLGLSPEMIESLTYRPQKTPGLFLSKDDAEKKEFLSSLLDLGKFEVQVEEANARISSLTAQTLTTASMVELYRKQVEDLSVGQPKPGDERPLMSEYERMNSEVKCAELELQKPKKAVEDFDRATDSRVAAVWSDYHEAEETAKRELEDAVKNRKPFEADDSEILRLRSLVDQLTVRIQRQEVIVAQRQREHQRKMGELRSEVAHLEALVGRQPEYDADLKKAESEIAAFEAQSCPTCERPGFEGDGLKAKLEAAREEAAIASHFLHKIAATKPEIEAVQIKLAEMSLLSFEDETLAKMRKLLPEKQAELGAAEATIKSARKVYDAEMETQIAHHATRLEKLYRTAQEEEQALRKKRAIERVPLAEALQKVADRLDAVRTQFVDAGGKLRILKAQNAVWLKADQQRIGILTARQADLTANEQGLAEANRQLAAEKDFVQLIGREGFLGAIFGEVLAEISAETNEIMRHVPNVSHLTLQFASDQETKKGTSKRRIVPIVFEGTEERPLKDLSGGMGTAVELAVDLAVGKVVSRRTGASPGWLVLDECFEGLDGVCKEACMEMLQRAAGDRLILVVDHSSAFKELFTQNIDIEFENGRSRIVEAP